MNKKFKKSKMVEYNQNYGCQLGEKTLKNMTQWTLSNAVIFHHWKMLTTDKKES